MISYKDYTCIKCKKDTVKGNRVHFLTGEVKCLPCLDADYEKWREEDRIKYGDVKPE